MSKVCPKCGMLNAEDRVVCTNCGTVLPAVAQGAPQGQPVPVPTQSYTAPNQAVPVPVPLYAPAENLPKKRYEVSRTVSGVLNVLAWVSLAFGILGGLLGGIFGLGSMFRNNAGGAGVFGALLGILGGAILGVIWFVVFKYSAELIHLAIDLEENTRRTAELLDKMQK